MQVFIWILFAVFLSATAYPIEIIAHRGSSMIAPENTLAAFKLAWEQGADACELDMRLSRDRQITILHDSDTRRTAGTFKVAAETPFAELRNLDVGGWKGAAYAKERIPTLVEALSTTPPGKRFFLEAKCGPEIVPILTRELESWKSMPSQVCIMAFNREVALKCKVALPWLKVYRLSSEKDREGRRINLDQLIADSKKDGLDGLSLSMNFPWHQLGRVRAAGLELYVWTVNDPDSVKYLSGLGIDGIITDTPVAAREALQAADRR